MNGQGEGEVYFLQQALLFQRISDFIFCVHDAGVVVDGDVHVERVDKSVGPAGFLFHSLLCVFEHFLKLGLVRILKFRRIQNLDG